MTRIYLSPPHTHPRDRELLLEAFDSNWIAPLGPQVDAFEQEFADRVGASHAVALSSGTAALHLALLLLGVGRGDRVLTSTLTFAATANAIRYVGAEPVFIDAAPETWTMDPAVLAEELEESERRGKRPAAVLPVDLYGQCADYDPIHAACEKHGVPILEDAAEALGATYRGRAAGGLGALGAFSFNGNKIITTSGGGMLVTERKEWADRARFLATQARDPAPHYQHSTIGYNYRLSNLLAALGRSQLAHLDERVAARRRNFDAYRRELSNLPGIRFMPEAEYGQATRWLTCLTIDPGPFGATCDDVRKHLETLDIEARPVWKPMHLQPVFEACEVRGGGVSQRLFEQGLCLPSGSSLKDDELARVVAGVRALAR